MEVRLYVTFLTVIMAEYNRRTGGFKQIPEHTHKGKESEYDKAAAEESTTHSEVLTFQHHQNFFLANVLNNTPHNISTRIFFFDSALCFHLV